MVKDDRKFDHLFRDYYEPLFRFAQQYVADEEDSHDIVTAAFEDVWRHFDTVKADTARQYLYTAVRHRTIDCLRRQNRHRRFVAYASYMSERCVSEERLAELPDMEKTVRQVLDRMGPPTDAILKACYADGKKYREVAQEMDVSVATVKKHMVKALKMLREIKKTLKP